MKIFFLAGLIACSCLGFAQTKIEKSIPVRPGQKVEMSFEFPELIKVRTWDKPEVLIKGMVSINNGENDDAFELLTGTKDNIVTVSSRLKDMDNIPHRTTIRMGDQDYYFPTKDPHDPAIKKFLEEKGKSYTYMSTGIMRKITLEVYLPKGVACKIDSKFGMVEITDFDSPLVVNSTFGGIDATLSPRKVGEVIARTQFGEILTNLDVSFQPVREGGGHDHWTEIKATLGTGSSCNFESKFGKVYLRKQQ